MKIFVCNDGIRDDGDPYESAYCVSESEREAIHAALDDWLNHAKNITPEREKLEADRNNHYALMFSVMVCRTHKD